MVTLPPESLGISKTGCLGGELVRPRKASKAFGFEVSLTRILVPSGWTENHSKSAMAAAPLAAPLWPATNRKGYTPAVGTAKPPITFTAPNDLVVSHSAIRGFGSSRIVAETATLLVR